MQVALYARVSTPRQYMNGLSVPDQLRQMRQWCERQGHVVVKEYVEPGDSATDDKRPVFQDMILDAQKKPVPFGMIVVHSFSRFFRDEIEATLYQRRLEKNGVKMASITQQTSDDPTGEIQRRMLMLFDEYQSKENAKHTLRGMQENARQGYFNGSKAPFGYQTLAVGQTGTHGRIKKKLTIYEPEAEIVREIFALYVHGKNNSPRIGMKEIAKTLNGRGLLMRGKPWRIQKVQNVLASTTYAGFHVFNRVDSKTLKLKPEAEWVKVPVPAIIGQDLFDKATKLRSVFTPIKCAPRRENSPNLLTGMLKCKCGASMVLMTAKNNTYRYYRCSARNNKGDTSCQVVSHSIEKLDNLVLNAFLYKVYTARFMRKIIDGMRQSASTRGGEEKHRTKKLEAELKEIEQAESKLYEAVEKGVLDLDDRLKSRIRQHKTRREEVVTELAALKHASQSPLQSLTPQKIQAVANTLNKRFGLSTPFSRAYLKATLREIRTDGKFLKISGDSKMMANLIAADGDIDPQNAVLRFIPEWRAR